MEFEFKSTPNGILLIADGVEVGLYRTMAEATKMADRIRDERSK